MVCLFSPLVTQLCIFVLFCCPLFQARNTFLVDYFQLMKRVRFSLELAHFVLRWQHCFRVYPSWAVAYAFALFLWLLWLRVRSVNGGETEWLVHLGHLPGCMLSGFVFRRVWVSHIEFVLFVSFILLLVMLCFAGMNLVASVFDAMAAFTWCSAWLLFCHIEGFDLFMQLS